jgi:ABC-type branched-subunit amino acid transport system substrate-binding protein
MRSRVVAAAIASVTVLGSAGCGTDEVVGQNEAVQSIRLYGVDGNMSNSLADGLKDPAVLTGMTGTLPLPHLPDEFVARLTARQPRLADFSYAGETYDAVVLAALAIQVSGTAEARTVARHVVGVTVQAPGGQICLRPATCLALIAKGTDIAYRGLSVRSAFTSQGEPSTATYGILHFGHDHRILQEKTEYVGAGNPAAGSTENGPAASTSAGPSTSADPSAAPEQAEPTQTPGDPTGGTPPLQDGDPVRLGVLLPRTGGLAAQGVPMYTAAELAVADINAAGGVLGHRVEMVAADDGTSADKAKTELARLVRKKVTIVVGPSTSGASAAVIPYAVAHDVLLISPSATSDDLTTVQDGGMFFRTAPPDTYQANALADIVMRAGARRVFIVARSDSYGVGLMRATQADLVDSGMAEQQIRTSTYTEDQTDFSGIAEDIQRFRPDSVIVVGYAESGAVIGAIAARNRIRTAT